METIHLKSASFGYPKVALEAGRFIGNPDRRIALKGAVVGATWLKDLVKTSQVQNWLFVSEPHREEVVRTYTTHGFEPEFVVTDTEPLLQQNALRLVDGIRQEAPTRFMSTRAGDFLSVEDAPKIQLLSQGKPTIALLDSVLTLAKIQQAGDGVLCLNVLPESEEAQQTQTRQILQTLGISVPLVSVLYNPETTISRPGAQ